MLWDRGVTRLRQEADTDRREKYEMERLKDDLLVAAVQTARTAELAERARIARDLHDHLGHELTAAGLALQAFDQLWKEGDEQAADMLAQAERRIAEGMAVLRATVSGIAPRQETGVGGLEEICRTLCDPAPELVVHGNAERIPAHAWSVLEACLKEGLTNALRHGAPGKVSVTLDVGPRIVRLCVHNEGSARKATARGAIGGGLGSSRPRAAKPPAAGTGRGRQPHDGRGQRLSPHLRPAAAGERAVKVLIVDDDPLVCQSLKVLLSREADIQVVGTANEGASALKACERTAPDAVLMDIRMPGMDGIEATRAIKSRWPGIHVVFLTTFSDDESVRAALQAGGEGYLLKSSPAAGMAQRLRALGADTAVIDSEVLKRLSEPDKEPLPGLTPRENEVAELVAQGCSNREIAERLFISEGTARNVLSIALEKLQLRDRTQLAIFYWRRRI